MVTPTCSICRREIPSEDVNVGKDVAFCRVCNVGHKLSALVHTVPVEIDLDLTQPPAGAWHHSSGLDTVIGASHRSFRTAIPALGVALFWNGIVSVFLLLVTSATLRHLGVEPPEWSPHDKDMGVGMTIFLWIFLIPFLVIGVGMIGAVLSSVAGRTEVRIGPSEGVVFTGIGPFGRRKRFDSRAVKDVRIEEPGLGSEQDRRRDKTEIVVELRDDEEVRFGASLPLERMKFVAGATRKLVR